MADKIATARSIPSKMYLGRRRVNVIYNARTKGQVFPFAPPLPIIDLVDPSTALSAGGSTVTITGAYYSSASAVRFGTTAAAFQIVNSTTITATVPAGVLGDTTITVTNATGVSNAYPFTYIDRPPAQRIYKSGRQDIGYFDDSLVTGWVTDPAYPASAIVNNGIFIPAGRSVLIEVGQVRESTRSGRVRVYDSSGAILAEVSAALPLTIPAFAYTPTVDTVITQTGYSSSGTGGANFIADDPGTYIMVTPT